MTVCFFHENVEQSTHCTAFQSIGYCTLCLDSSTKQFSWTHWKSESFSEFRIETNTRLHIYVVLKALLHTQTHILANATNVERNETQKPCLYIAIQRHTSTHYNHHRAVPSNTLTKRSAVIIEMKTFKTVCESSAPISVVIRPLFSKQATTHKFRWRLSWCRPLIAREFRSKYFVSRIFF